MVFYLTCVVVPTWGRMQLALLSMDVHNMVKNGIAVVVPNNPFAHPLGPTFPEFVQYVVDTLFDDEH